MPDHDMSQTACQTRARIRKEHDQMLEDIKVLKRETEELQDKSHEELMAQLDTLGTQLKELPTKDTNTSCQKEHDQMLADIKVLKHEIADLQERTNVLLNMVISFLPEIIDDFEQWSKEHPDA